MTTSPYLCSLLREDPVKGVCIPGLTELEVGTLESTMKQLEKGSSNRVTAATAMNKVRSNDPLSQKMSEMQTKTSWKTTYRV